MTKKLLFCAMMLVSLVGLTACGGGTKKEEIRISGSTSVSPIVSKLAESFEKQNANYMVIIESVGSTIGVRDSIDGKNHIGMVSRNVKADELESVDTTVLCQDGIALIVNKESELSEINKQGLSDLYIKNTPVADITKSVSREDGSGTRGAFGELTGIGGDAPLPQTVEILDGTGKIKSAVANDKNKLGYISLGSVDDTIKTLAYNNGTQVAYVMPSVENISSGEYKLYRPFNLVTKKGTERTEGVQAFFDFINSEEGQAIIIENGFIPVN